MFSRYMQKTPKKQKAITTTKQTNKQTNKQTKNPCYAVLVCHFGKNEFRSLSLRKDHLFVCVAGQYNFTVVTAMMDVGRGQWGFQGRPYNVYLLNMQRVLRLDVNIIAFVDAKARPFIDWMRRGREARTRVVELSLQDLPYYSYRDRVVEIMKSDKYRKDNELVQQNLCESKYPDYNIVQWSKLYFINEAIEANPFQNDFFFWLDGGYGHGNDVHPHDGIWRPKNIFEYPNKVTFIEREPVELYRNKLDHLHKLSVSVLAGLFYGGGKGAMQRMYKMQQELLTEWMRDGIQDDDQNTYVQMYFRQPDLFHLVPGDWYDVFVLFN